MRIIGGKAKGRPLAAVVGSVRPTSDRAREGLFSSLISEFGDFDGVNFLDLFAGSGAIGLEALSRGAKVLHSVEKDERAARTINANIEIVKKGNALGDFHLYSLSVEKFLELPAPLSYHIIYLDPPFELSDAELYKSLHAIRAGGFLHREGLIAVERASKSERRGGLQWPLGFVGLRERNYGQALIYYGSLSE